MSDEITCPVCGSINPTHVCKRCGTDFSVCYEEYPTLCPVAETQSLAELRRRLFDESKQLLQELSMLHFQYACLKSTCDDQTRTIRQQAEQLKQCQTGSNQITFENLQELQIENEKLSSLCHAQAETISRMEKDISRLSIQLSKYQK